MTFERSAQGQANRADFYGVDITCYVEGEDQSEAGDDVYFWHLVFSTLQPSLSIKFLSRGGKPQLEALARDVVANDVDNVFVAMDADYSRFFGGRIIDDPRVFYTFGYSWENDIFSPGVDEIAFKDVARAPNIPLSAASFQRSAWRSLEKSLGLLMIADFHAFRCGGSIVDARKPGQFLQKLENGLPGMNRSNALTRIMAFNTETRNRNPRQCLDRPREPMRYAKGRLLAFSSRLIVNASARNFGGGKEVNEPHCRSIYMTIFRERLRSAQNDPVVVHHQAQVHRIAA